MLRYVNTTMDYGNMYKSNATIRLEGYTNADWAGYKADRRSTSGFVYSVGSAAISWSSKKQPTFALSSTEAEYKGATIATCEAVWLKRILKDLGIRLTDHIRLFYDNMSSIYLARNPAFHARTKHIEVHYHFICERVQAGEINLQHISMNLQVADIFTKALGVDKLMQFASELGLTTSTLLYLRGSTVSGHAHEIEKPNNPVRGLRTPEARFRKPNRNNFSTDGSCVRRGMLRVELTFP